MDEENSKEHGQRRIGGDIGMEIILCIGTSVVTAVVVTKILATHYFEIVDGHVKEMCDETKQFVEDIKCQVHNSL